MGGLNSVNVLDCTLRDGGYVNNWEFNKYTSTHIMDSLYSSGIRCIEIGLLGKADSQEIVQSFLPLWKWDHC